MQMLNRELNVKASDLLVAGLFRGKLQETINRITKAIVKQFSPHPGIKKIHQWMSHDIC